MEVIGFFQNVINSFGGLLGFISTPLGEQFEGLEYIPYVRDMSILGMLGVGLVATLGVFIVIHAVRLFIGG